MGGGHEKHAEAGHEKHTEAGHETGHEEHHEVGENEEESPFITIFFIVIIAISCSVIYGTYIVY